MKANEFIKDKGFDEAKRHLECYGWRNTPFIIKLKRLVESHELVESYGGIDKAKTFADSEYRRLSQPKTHKQLFDAILDVESCHVD